MSRIGKKIIILPANTELKVAGDRVLVKGPLGELSRALHPVIEVRVSGNEVTVHPKKTSIESRALWGTYASHITNMISGVNKLFEKGLILEGVGFKSEVQGNKINLALGFSHPVIVPIPEGLKVTAEKNVITVSGKDKEEVGQFTSRLRSLKKPEPYKGKGMRYRDEIIRRKQGKKLV
ncbi:MAG: 50S ribosomal protein L6 [bacterium]|nr:50S ribosomal protein L6 [bacterium]